MVVPSNASLQMCCVVSNRLSGTQQTNIQDRQRYRVLNDQEQQQEKQEIKQMVHQFRFQHKCQQQHQKLYTHGPTCSPPSPSRKSHVPPRPHSARVYHSNRLQLFSPTVPRSLERDQPDDDDEDEDVECAPPVIHQSTRRKSLNGDEHHHTTAFERKLMQEILALKQQQKQDLKMLQEFQAASTMQRNLETLFQMRSNARVSRKSHAATTRSATTTTQRPHTQRVSKDRTRVRDQGVPSDESADDQHLDQHDLGDLTQPPPSYFDDQDDDEQLPLYAQDVDGDAEREHAIPASTIDDHDAHATESDSDDHPRLQLQRSHSARHAAADQVSPHPHSTTSPVMTRPHHRLRPQSAPRVRTTKDKDNNSNSNSVRKSVFFMEKEQRRLEQEEREREAARRLERAKHASPPKQLLEHQEQSKQKKQLQLQLWAQEMNIECSKDKKIKAREIPLTTYVNPTDLQLQEQIRKDRILQRCQQLLQMSRLPSRMETQSSSKTHQAGSLSISKKKKLAEQKAEQQRIQKLLKPKPVPNFDQQHRKWATLLARKFELHREHATVPKEFFQQQKAQLETLRTKKQLRKDKLLQQERERQQAQALAQQKLLDKVRHEAETKPLKVKITKSSELKWKQTKESIESRQRHAQQREQEEQARLAKQLQASKAIREQLKDFYGANDDPEQKRKQTPEEIAAQKAKQSREEFQRSIKENRERIELAVAKRPSLLERYSFDLKKQDNKRQALEAVVKNVLNHKDLPKKDLMSDEEQQLARQLARNDARDAAHEPNESKKHVKDDYTDDAFDDK